jgi:hypothetical protein
MEDKLLLGILCSNFIYQFWKYEGPAHILKAIYLFGCLEYFQYTAFISAFKSMHKITINSRPPQSECVPARHIL